jgi:E3 ubiquitin-protein ligase synoviolin
MYGLQRLLFGPLRPIEIEQLYERGWIAATEWLFALSIFREEFGVSYMAIFILLFVSKVWGWMVDGRLETLEQQNPAHATTFHTRLVTATLINVLLPLRMANYCLDEAVYGIRPGVMTMFTFEFGILLIGAASTAFRYSLWAYEHRIIQQQMAQRIQELRAAAVESGAPMPAAADLDVHELDLPGWEGKGSVQFALDIGTGESARKDIVPQDYVC